MILDLTDTTTAALQSELDRARHRLGTTSGLVFTLIVVAAPDRYDMALAAAIKTGREHPSRILLITDGQAEPDRLDASLQIGEDAPGEIITLRFHGRLREHRATVALPLLLPDLPVIAFWPGVSPEVPGSDPLGRLAARRITDAMGDPEALAALEVRARHYCPGDTDLTWTRITRWRGLLAAALDAYPIEIRNAEVTAAPGNAAGTLLAAWLADRLGVPVRLAETNTGIGINGIRLVGDTEEIRIRRTDGNLASFTAPGLPDRLVALPRRDLTTLLSEELRRLDDDPIYAESMAALVRRLDRIPGEAE